MADDRPYLLHIRDAIDRIRSYTHQGKEAFFTSSLLQDAVIRNLEIIGEAAKRISPSTKAQAAEIPWQLVAGMRDVLLSEFGASGVISYASCEELQSRWGAVARRSESRREGRRFTGILLVRRHHPVAADPSRS